MKSHTKIFLFIALGMWQSKINSVNTLCFNINTNKINGILKQNNGDKYLILVLIYENKDTLKKICRAMEQNQGSF